MPKYYAYTDNKKMVKVGCRHRGEMIFGIAKCDDTDTFDYNKGYALAKARCDDAITRARYEEFAVEAALADMMVDFWKSKSERIEKHTADAKKIWDDVRKELEKAERDCGL